MMTIRVLLADDSDLLLTGAKSALETDHRFKVVATARAINDLLANVSTTQPDVVIFGDWLAGMDALAIVERLKRLPWLPRLIVIGSLMDGLLIRDLLAAGADGYLYRCDDLEDHVGHAVLTVLRGRPYLSPTANAEYLYAMRSPLRDWQLDDESRSVLRMLADGCVIGEIARSLGVPVRRIYWIREKLRRRFNAQTNEHLISRASAEGFLNAKVSV